MHFPYPTRKSSHPTPYAVRSSRSTLLRQRSPKQLAAIAIGAIVGLWLLLKLFLGGSGDGYVPPGTPGAVVVTVLEPGLSESYKEAIKANRRDYASRHGECSESFAEGRNQNYAWTAQYTHTSREEQGSKQGSRRAREMGEGWCGTIHSRERRSLTERIACL